LTPADTVCQIKSRLSQLNDLLVRTLGEHGIVFPQSPVRLDAHNEPQPDFIVVKPRPQGYRAPLPTPEDVLVLIEVAASSLAYDRGLKLALYARHGIPEVWIVNLAAQEIEVFRKPTGDNYGSSVRVDRLGSLEIEALPGVRIAADGIFG
jgi:Uma2 family endonuclease